jgi:hypothetical protein
MYNISINNSIDRLTFNITSTDSSSSAPPIRLALSVTHLLLVIVGSVNLLVVAIILLKPYMRSITNVYMISLCLADFLYLVNLVLVAVTQLNNRTWIFGQTLCTFYHGMDATGICLINKYVTN